MPRANSIAIELNPLQKDRFWSKVNLLPQTTEKDCWIWCGRVDGFGYGHFKTRYRSLKAHRVAWTLQRGPIPAGMTLDHLCRNPRCVNPAHLQIVTNKENILRGESPTAKNARQTHCKRGHPLTPSTCESRRGRRDCLLCRRLRRGI